MQSVLLDPRRYLYKDIYNDVMVCLYFFNKMVLIFFIQERLREGSKDGKNRYGISKVFDKEADECKLLVEVKRICSQERGHLREKVSLYRCTITMLTISYIYISFWMVSVGEEMHPLNRSTQHVPPLVRSTTYHQVQ